MANEQFSDDGNWWWNGREWVPADQAPAGAASTDHHKNSRWAAIRSKAGDVAQAAAVQAVQAAERAWEERERRAAESQVEAAVKAQQEQVRRAQEEQARAADRAAAAQELARLRAACPLPIVTDRRTLPGGLQILAGEYLVATAKHWGFSSDRLALTTHRLLFSHGRLGKEAKQVFLSDITDVVYTKPLIGTGTLMVEVAGTRHNLEGLVHTKHARQFRDSLLAMVHFARQERQRVVINQVPSPLSTSESAAADPYEQLARLAELRDRGVLSEQEFAAEKAKILRRGS